MNRLTTRISYVAENREENEIRENIVGNSTEQPKLMAEQAEKWGKSVERLDSPHI
jgi:hypothetical protein